MERICPEAGEASAVFIDTLASDPVSNGIAVTFTEAGMAHALKCDGATELAVMVATLYARLPERARAEAGIGWAIEEMAREIRGHALVYRVAFSQMLRARANPVNIDFPQYRGIFPNGFAGLSARLLRLYYRVLCH